MDSRTEKLLWFGVSTAIIASMVYLADVGKFLEAIRTAKIKFLIPAFAAGLSVFFVWAYVWYSFFRSMKLGITYLKSLRVFMAGHFMNSITPIGQFGGEPIMAYLISNNSESSYEKAFSTVVSADIINAVPMFTFVLGGTVYLYALGATNQVVIQSFYLALLVTVLGGALVYLLWFKAGSIEKGLVTLLRWVSRTMGLGNGFVDTVEQKLAKVEDAFETIGESPRHLLKVATVSHAGFLLQVFCLYFIMLSVGTQVEVASLYFVVALAGFGNFSPTPGGSGTFEALMAGLLTVFAPMQFASALIVAIIFRLTTFWPGLLVGYLSLNTLQNGGGS